MNEQLTEAIREINGMRQHTSMLMHHLASGDFDMLNVLGRLYVHQMQLEAVSNLLVDGLEVIPAPEVLPSLKPQGKKKPTPKRKYAPRSSIVKPEDRYITDCPKCGAVANFLCFSTAWDPVGKKLVVDETRTVMNPHRERLDEVRKLQGTTIVPPGTMLAANGGEVTVARTGNPDA